MARKKKRIGRLPLDRLPSFMTKPSPGPARGKALDLLMPKPKGSQQHMQPKGPKPDVQPKVRTLKVQPKVPQPDRVHEDKVSKMTTIVCWDLASDVSYYQVRNLLKDISGVIDISFSSTKHCAVLQFATAIAAQAALYQLTGCYLMGRPLKFAWFDKNGYDPNRDSLPTMEFLPSRVPRTIYIKGFNSSLSIAQIRSMLKSHFALSCGARIITPQNPDGTSTG
ncbi:hypothetical protein C2845_PM13G17910 [Panicum miliaceum]|uniref:RRM domain-containing protein n=1 Tax=Panicum miliaceum TaxID=4540 RepID=A0A3L6RJY2_PANMI|nr:hypothetical protein C2845_PM13G17910 [Panicum miliaceum]